MRVLTINLQHGGGTRGQRLANFITDQLADVAVLTEYRANATGRQIRSELAERGYKYQTTHAPDEKQNSVCILSRLPFERLDIDNSREPESHRMVAIKLPSLNLAGVYFPQNEAKRPVFERLKSQFLPRLGVFGVVLGDFNTGRPFEDEAGKTFHCADCFDDLLSAGLVDSWRSRNAVAREFTWYSRSNNGFRIDHALSTPAFDQSIKFVQYLHEARTSRITDHSALLLHSDG